MEWDNTHLSEGETRWLPWVVWFLILEQAKDCCVDETRTAEDPEIRLFHQLPSPFKHFRKGKVWAGFLLRTVRLPRDIPIQKRCKSKACELIISSTLHERQCQLSTPYWLRIYIYVLYFCGQRKSGYDWFHEITNHRLCLFTFLIWAFGLVWGSERGERWVAFFSGSREPIGCFSDGHEEMRLGLLRGVESKFYFSEQRTSWKFYWPSLLG